MGIHLCSGTRKVQPRSPVESSEEESSSRIRSQNRRPPILTESQLRDLQKADMETRKSNSQRNLRSGQIDKSVLVPPSSAGSPGWEPALRKRRSLSQPILPFTKMSDASEEEIMNRKAAMKKEIKEVLKPYLFLNELCRLDRELDTLCDGLLTNALSSELPSTQMDDAKSYVEESSSLVSGKGESGNIDFERSTPGVSEQQEVILMSNQLMGEEIRRSLVHTTKIDRLKKKSAKIAAEIARLEKQNADAILSTECNYSIMRSREHEIIRLKKLDNITWEQISSSISLMKAEIKPSGTEENSREIQEGATTNPPFSSSTPPARQICVSSGDPDTEKEKSSAKHAGILTHEPQQSGEILQSNDSQGTDSFPRIQDKIANHQCSRTDVAINNEGEPHSKSNSEVFSNDINPELVQMP